MGRHSTRWRYWRYFILVLLLSPADSICPNKCLCNEDTLVVNCTNASLSVFPYTINPSVRQLILNKNHVEEIQEPDLEHYGELEFLDLSHNQLVALEPRVFTSQKQLAVLKLSKNRISRVQTDTFIGLDYLKVLHLNDNLLSSVGDRLFIKLESLEELDLAKNSIGVVSPKAFEGLTNLRTLILTDNKLSNIPSASFVPLISMLALGLGGNPIQQIPGGSFENLPNLQKLNLDGCNLASLGDRSLKGLDSLRVLKLQNNLLTDIPTQALQKVPKLEEIYLGENPFHEMKATAFRGLRHLRLIDVSGALEFNVVRKHAFLGCDLETLRLNRNPHLGTLEEGSFEGVAGLRHLYLRGNSFSTFSETWLAWDELDALDLRDNPLECNCSILWLRNLLHNRNFSTSYAKPPVNCATPFHMRTKNLAEASTEDLSCNHFADIRQQVILGVIVGAALACLATLVLFIFNYRKRVTSVLKDKWNDGALRRKDLQYEKTNDEEENNIIHIAANQSLKLTPVTEL